MNGGGGGAELESFVELVALQAPVSTAAAAAMAMARSLALAARRGRDADRAPAVPLSLSRPSTTRPSLVGQILVAGADGSVQGRMPRAMPCARGRTDAGLPLCVRRGRR